MGLWESRQLEAIDNPPNDRACSCPSRSRVGFIKCLSYTSRVPAFGEVIHQSRSSSKGIHKLAVIHRVVSTFRNASSWVCGVGALEGVQGCRALRGAGHPGNIIGMKREVGRD